MEWDVMGEQRVVSVYLSSSPLLLERAICRCWQREVYLSRHPSCGCRTQSVGLALVTVDFVRATTPPKLGTEKSKTKQ